ncbi:MAG TPA: chorismate synthase [Acidimicrobiales bacterium]|nr:chorismate synthase [Acidimicrobiales bacterium]
MLRFLTAGESHGQALVTIVEGLPAGLPITVDAVSAELARRRLGYGRGPRMRLERDEVTILAGVRHGLTLGSPVAVQIGNTEWSKWEAEMSAAPGSSDKPLTAPRPGHADLAGMQKYGLDDARNVLERASARETAARSVAGVLSKVLLKQLDIDVFSHVVAIGPVQSKRAERPCPQDLAAIDASAVRCFDPEAEADMIREIETAGPAGDSLGGVAEVIATSVPVGLGSHVHWDRRLDARLAAALMSIQAVKGVEIGDGFESATRRGSEGHDAITWNQDDGYHRTTDRAGGIEGGMSIGGAIRARVAMKPLATLRRPAIATVDTVTKEETKSFVERTDVTAVPAMGVVAEAMVAYVLADEALRKFGGDSVDEFTRNHHAFLDSLRG